jgi:hypothetical protein
VIAVASSSILKELSVQYRTAAAIEYDGAIVTVDVVNKTTNKSVTVKAQLDTGAVVSCASYPKVLQPLGVPLFDKVTLSHLQSGQREQNERYQVNIGMHFPQGVYSWDNVTIVRKELNEVPYDVVVGRDMLERCLFTYDGRIKSFSLVIDS